MIKLNQLAVTLDADAAGYQAAMAQKVAADQAGSASSAALGAAITQTDQKLTRASSGLERLSRTYVDGYGTASRFNSELNALGRVVDKTNVPIDRASAILEGIYRKFQMTTTASELASRGFAGLAQAAEQVNQRLEASGRMDLYTGRVRAATEASGRLATGMGEIGKAALDQKLIGERIAAGMSSANAVPGILRQKDAEAAAAASARVVTGMSSIGAAALAANRDSERLIKGMSGLSGEMGGTARQAALSYQAMMNLSFQINDVATMAAMGADPMRIFATQAGQFYQVLSMGEGGVRGSLAYLGSVFVSMLTPLRLLTAGVTAFGAAALIAFNSAQRDAARINIALSGVGAASGTTAQRINEIAQAAAVAGQQSVAGARDMAITLTATGKIGDEMAEKLVGIGRRFEKAFGVDAAGAAQKLAEAFANPSRGAEDFAKVLGTIDDNALQSVRSLERQGKVFEAQALLLEKTKQGLVGSVAATTDLDRAWQRLSDTWSNAWDRYKQMINRMSSEQPVSEQLMAAQARLTELQRSNEGPRSRGVPGPSQEEIRKQIALVDELTASIKEQNAALEANKATAVSSRLSREAGSVARRLSPEYEQLQNAKDDLTRLRDAQANPASVAGSDASSLAAIRQSEKLLAAQVAWREKALANGGIQLQTAREENALALQTMAARSVGERASAAYAAAYTRAQREGRPDAEALASLASRRVIEEDKILRTHEAEARVFNGNERVAQANAEAEALGRSAGEAARLQSYYQQMADLREKAFQRKELVTKDEVENAERVAAELGKAADAKARAGLKNDLNFELQQMGRSPQEQDVYSRLQGAGLLDNGQITDDATRASAAQIRYNNAVRESQDLTREWAQGLSQDLRNGASLTESLTNSMGRLADRLISMALDASINQLFGAMFGGGATGSPGGGIMTSLISAGIFHEGGLVGANDNGAARMLPSSLFASAPRFHSGVNLGNDEVPAILQRGEVVVPKGAKFQSDGAGGGQAISITYQIDATGADQAAIARLEMAVAKSEANTLRIIRDARDRRRA